MRTRKRYPLRVSLLPGGGSSTRAGFNYFRVLQRSRTIGCVYIYKINKDGLIDFKELVCVIMEAETSKSFRVGHQARDPGRADLAVQI